MQTKKFILITIDVEEWYQVENLRRWMPSEKWDKQQSRAEFSTHRILDLLESAPQKIEATFFVLGQVAKKFPGLVRELSRRGHEVASHGFNHQLCTRMSSKELIYDLDYSKKLLEDISGKQVNGYRAPSFSVSERILSAIRNCGYQYDSSYNNFELHGRYGKLNLKRYPQKGIAFLIDNCFYELPISNLKIAEKIIPWGGGGYFRLLPFLIYKLGVDHILEKTGTHLFYFHPWEIDSKQPRISGSNSLSLMRHYVGLKKVYPRLQEMFRKYEYCNFSTCSSYINKMHSHSKDMTSRVHE